MPKLCVAFFPEWSAARECLLTHDRRLVAGKVAHEARIKGLRKKIRSVPRRPRTPGLRQTAVLAYATALRFWRSFRFGGDAGPPPLPITASAPPSLVLSDQNLVRLQPPIGHGATHLRLPDTTVSFTSRRGRDFR